MKELSVTAKDAHRSQKVEFGYVPALDGVRAAAVLAVIFFHSTWIFPAFEPYSKGGFLGVDIFFVLSGFLITSILLAEFDETKSVGIRNFYTRRFLRLMPAYWAYLGVLYVFAPVLFHRSEVDRLYANDNFLMALIYGTNWHRAINGGEITGLLSPTWSLAVEEQFYLLWPALLLLMLRHLPRRSIVTLTALGIAASAVSRALRWDGDQSVDLLYNAFDTRADALLVGCLVGLVFCWRMVPAGWVTAKWARLVLLMCLGAALIIPSYAHASFRTPFLYQGGLTVFAVAIGVMIFWLATRRDTRTFQMLSCQPLVWVGKISYGLYLWHTVAIAFVQHMEMSPFIKLAASLGLAFGAAALSHYMIEKPFLRLKRQFTPDRSEHVQLLRPAGRTV